MLDYRVIATRITQNKADKESTIIIIIITRNDFRVYLPNTLSQRTKVSCMNGIRTITHPA